MLRSKLKKKERRVIFLEAQKYLLFVTKHLMIHFLKHARTNKYPRTERQCYSNIYMCETRLNISQF